MFNPPSPISRVWRKLCHPSKCPGTAAPHRLHLTFWTYKSQDSCFSLHLGEVGTGSARAPSLARVCSSSLPGPDNGLEGIQLGCSLPEPSSCL